MVYTKIFQLREGQHWSRRLTEQCPMARTHEFELNHVYHVYCQQIILLILRAITLIHKQNQQNKRCPFTVSFNPYSAGIDFRRQNLTFADVRFCHLKTIPALKELKKYDGRKPIIWATRYSNEHVKRKELTETSIWWFLNWKNTLVSMVYTTIFPTTSSRRRIRN